MSVLETSDSVINRIAYLQSEAPLVCRFSVVIPTKNRPQTLRHCLRTCLEQDFDDYEIVVFDNAGGEATRAVVEELSAAPIKYYRAEVLLSMQDSWDTALSHAEGEIVIVIGDDDGLMPFALSTLDRLFRSSDIGAVTWQCGVYTWPDMALTDQANLLLFSLAEKVRRLDSKSIMKESLYNADKMPLLPNVYHGAIRKQVLDEVRRRAGRVFAGVHPDTFSSFSIAYILGEHAYLDAPMSITGFSGSSGNVAFTLERNASALGAAIRADNAKHGLFYHPSVPDLPSPLCVAADSFLQVKTRLFQSDGDLVLDRKRFADALRDALPVAGADQIDAAQAEIARTLADDPKLLKWFEARIKTSDPRIKPRATFKPASFQPGWGFLHIDTRPLGVTDVHGATKIAAAVLGYGLRTLSPVVPPREKLRSRFGLFARGARPS